MDIGHVDGHTDNRVTRVAATGVVVWFVGAEATEAAFRALHCESARHCWTQIELPATSSVALRRTTLEVLKACNYLDTLAQHLPARALMAPAGLFGVLDEHLREGGSFESTDLIPAHWLARGAFSHDAASGERLVERILFTLVRAGDSKAAGGLCTVCTKSSAASTSQKCGLRMASGVGGTGVSDRDWHTIELDGVCYLLCGLFPACVSCTLRAQRDRTGKFQVGTCYPLALAKETRPPKVVSGVLVWDFEREVWRTGTEEDHQRAISVGVSLWAGRTSPRFLDLQRALADTASGRRTCNPFDSTVSMQSVWSLRLRVADARRRAPEQRLLYADAAARVGQPAEGSCAQLLALSELYCIRGVCGLRLRDGRCDALLDLFVRNVGVAADEEANHVFPSLRRQWFNVSELLACLRAASAPESTEVTPAVAEWVLLSALVWLLGQFRTDREVPEETHAARRLGRELLDAFDNGFAWSASRAVTADFSAERVRCLEELRAAAEWDLRTWLRSLGIASAPPGARPEAIGVGHAWLGNDASLTQDSNTAPTSVLCALDWHKCGLPVIHPRRHPGLLLQVWAHVPIRYPDAQAPLALLLFCLQVGCTEYRDLLARAWDGPAGELPDGSPLGHGVYTLLVELRRTMLGCLPGADPAAAPPTFPAARDVTAVADCMYGLCMERSWHLLLGLGSLLAVVEALFDALPLVPPKLSDPHTGEERSRPHPGVRNSHNGSRLTVRAGNTSECSLRACLLEAAVRAGTLNGPATLMTAAPLLLVITVDRVDADGMGNFQCIRAGLSLALDEVFPGHCHGVLPEGRENWYVLRAILGEWRHPSGVHRPFALLPALGRRQRGAVAGWLLVLFGAAAFPEFFETEAEVEEVLGMPAGRCAIAFIYERRWSPAIMPSVRVPAVSGTVLVPPQQDDVAVRGPKYTSVVCPGPAAEHVRGLLQPRPHTGLHSLLEVPADGLLVAGGLHGWSAPDIQLWGHSGPPSAPWISSKHESYLTLALRLPSHEQELRSVALLVALASILPAPGVLACDRPRMSAEELLLWTAICHARATFLPPPRARNGISGRLPRADLHRQQYEAIADLGRLLRAGGWRSLHDPPDLLLFLDCWLQLCGQPALALLPRASLPDYPQGPLPDRVPPVVQHELDALNVRLAEDDDSVGDTRALSFALQQDGDDVAVGLQSLLCLLEGARRPVPSVPHEPSSAQSLEHEPISPTSLRETATHTVRIDAPSSELPDHHPDHVPVPDRETVRGLPARSWADDFDFNMCRLCPSTRSTPVIRLCMVFRPMRSRHFGVTCSQCADAGEGHGCDWSDAHSDPHLVNIAGVLWQVISPGASCSACVDDPGSCRPAEERERSPWFICLVLDDARWRLAQARDHERAVEQGCCLGDVSDLPPIQFRTLRRLVQDSVDALQASDAPTRGPPKATMASNMLVRLGVFTQLELHGRWWACDAQGSGFERLSTAPPVLTFRLVRPMAGAAAEVVLPTFFDPHALGLDAPLRVGTVPPRCARYVLLSAICAGPAGQYFCMFDSDGTASASWGGDTGPPFRLGHELVGAVYVLETHSALASDGSVSRNTVAQSPTAPAVEACSVPSAAIGTLCAPCGDFIDAHGVSLRCTHCLCAACWGHAVAFAVRVTPTALQPESCKVVCPVCSAFSLVDPGEARLAAKQVADDHNEPSRNASRTFFPGRKASQPNNRHAKHASAFEVHLSVLLLDCSTPPGDGSSVATTSAVENVAAAESSSPAAAASADGTAKRSRSSSVSPKAASSSAVPKRLRTTDAEPAKPASPAPTPGDQQVVTPPAELIPAPAEEQSQAPEQRSDMIGDGSPLDVLVAVAEEDRDRPPSEPTYPPLSEWLQALHLQDLLPALQDLGADRVLDLLELEDEIAELKLKVLHAKRLQKALQALRPGSTDTLTTSSAGVPGALSAAPVVTATATAAAPAASADAAAPVHAATAATEPSVISGAAAAAAAPAPGEGGDAVGTMQMVAAVSTVASQPAHAAEPSEATGASAAISEPTSAPGDRQTGDGAQRSYA